MATANDKKLGILSDQISALRGLISAHGLTLSKHSAALHSPDPRNRESAPILHSTSPPPARATVVAGVIDALRVAQIRERSQEDTQLTADFNRVQKEDEHVGKPGFRLGVFLDLLHHRYPWFWTLGPGELLNGHPATPGEIADRILATA